MKRRGSVLLGQVQAQLLRSLRPTQRRCSSPAGLEPVNGVAQALFLRPSRRADQDGRLIIKRDQTEHVVVVERIDQAAQRIARGADPVAAHRAADIDRQAEVQGLALKWSLDPRIKTDLDQGLRSPLDADQVDGSYPRLNA